MLIPNLEGLEVLLPQAKVISEDDFGNLLEKSKTCLVFVKNVPEDSIAGQGQDEQVRSSLSTFWT